MDLNGLWELSRTDRHSEFPREFDRKVPVPGLIDMAEPFFQDHDSGLYESSTYWYKKTFNVDHSTSDVVRLKINKAKYNTRVYVNNQLAGENSYCFTPAYFDIKTLLNDSGEENTLLIAVGCRNDLPDTVISGVDYEKTKYIPGIYDEVKLIISKASFIRNIQTAPDPAREELRIVADIEMANTDQELDFSYVIREVSSGQTVIRSSEKNIKLRDNRYVDITVPMPDCRLWSPDDPFLYELELSTRNDQVKTRFGMRSFSFDKEAGIALLNGEPYYMRGTNVCIFRFFEDRSRAGLPWDDQWVVKLHQKFKEMNWNSIRYCIGFPPERWYDIADSLGILIQDEYPIWTGLGHFNNIYTGVTSDHLSSEYTDWMEERWNHPCVVIWDAQNESVTEVVGDAILKVRHKDLSNRPWDNGFAAPVNESDCIESHPYLFNRYLGDGVVPSEDGVLKDLLTEVLDPHNDPNERDPRSDGKRYSNPVIINEYAWLWLNRDGTPTTITEKIYQVVFPEASNPEKRVEAYAKTLGILTEYWRVHRKCAAVMHFCGLGYSRPDPPLGQTSDNFIDIHNLTYEPYFYQYVKPAFNPVGLMIEVWDKSFESGGTMTVPVHMINDTHVDWNGQMKLYIGTADEAFSEQIIHCELNGLEKKVYSEKLKIPEERGKYQLIAEIVYRGESVKSIRDILVE